MKDKLKYSLAVGKHSKLFAWRRHKKGRAVLIAQKDVNFSQNIFERFELFAPHAIEARVSKAKFDLKGNF